MALIIILTAIFLSLPILSRLYIYGKVKEKIFAVDTVPASQIAIVFGAGLNHAGQPTTVLRDRIDTAVRLYQTGKVTKLLFSGDNRTENYNEPLSMKIYAISLGIPEDSIILDFAGRRTYDTCYRAKEIFGVENAILVTQRFHLARALYTCQELGIQSTGVPADIHRYRPMILFLWNIRETFASMIAIMDLKITHPQPVLGKPQPIFPKETQ
ncbi:MAG: SanA/YdcF family protein [Anaerolineales bacterium]